MRNIQILEWVNICSFMHLRDRTFNGVNKRLKVFLSGHGSFAGTSPTRSTFPSLLSPTTASLFYVARSILQPPLSYNPPYLAPLFQNVPSLISFWELSFVLSHHFFFRLHPLSHCRPPNLQLTLYHHALFLNAAFVSAISSCVLKQLSFLVSLPTWIITSSARKAPSLPFFHSVFCSLTLAGLKSKRFNALNPPWQ